MTERVAYVELDLNRCSLEYGVAPCTAEVGVTGERKCFNTFATCQDQANYATETVTVRYAMVTGDPPINIDAIPNIQSIDIRPAKLELGESIGIRASVTIKFRDHRFPDTGPDGDKYVNERPYDPYTQGTYWGKFRARQPFTRGQDIRIIRGNSDQSLAQMETRHFVVDQVAGPESDGTLTIVAKDALKLADGDRAQAPRLSNGYLSAAITDTDTSLTLEPVGIGDIDYPASGTAQIGGKEIVTFTRSGDSITLTGRGLEGTEAQEHDAEDRFQLCVTYSAKKATVIIEDLLTTYANVPASYIPSSSWQTEDDNYIARLYGATIAEPQAVSDLVNELLSQTASTIWWDDETRLLRFRVLRAVSSEAAKYDNDLIVTGSFSAKDQPDKRISQVWTYYGQLNPLEDLDDPKNYRSALGTVDLQSETNFGGVPAIREIFSRWIPAFARDAASRLNNLILSRYSTPPRLLSFTLQRDDNLVRPQLGGGYRLEHWTLQDDTGAPATLDVQVIQIRNTDARHGVLAEEVLLSSTVAPEDPNDRPIIIDTDVNNVNLRDLYDAQFTAPDASTVVTVTVEAGVIVGSGSTSAYAMETGDWPEGPTLKIINLGRIQGKGGAGGAGGEVTSSETVTNGANGQPGGDALLIEYDTEIDNGAGEIWSGGGGGGGSAAAAAGAEFDSGSPLFETANAYASVSGSGGGAGAGITASNGGLAGSNDADTGELSESDDKTGANGQSSSSATEGAGGGNRFASASDTFFDGDESVSASANHSGGGAGGGPGLSGSAGSASTATASTTLDPGNPSYSGYSEYERTSSPGSGGAAGRAIVQSGATATITNSGDIRGAIV